MRNCRLFVLLTIVPIVFIMGCESPPTYGDSDSKYPGVSSHFSRTGAESNMRSGYKEPPTFGGEPAKLSFFLFSADWYLESVESDLKRITAIAKNAREKTEAVARATLTESGYFMVAPVRDEFLPYSLRSTNFKFLDYPPFSDFDARFPLRDPGVPDFLYRYEVRCFFATVKDYIEDGNHFVRNCKNDYENVRKKGLELQSYVERLKAASDKEAK